MLGLQYFTFREQWSPLFAFGMAAIVILYFYVDGPYRRKHAPAEQSTSAWQKTSFLTGAILFYLSQGGPLSLLGHMMFSFHMLNMSFSYLLVPPLVLLGSTSYMWRLLFQASIWKRFRSLMHPILCLVLFNMVFSIYHIPDVHDYVMTHYTVHRLFYVVLTITSFMMWFHVTCPVPEWNRLTDLRKMAYVFANGALLTPACALIIFAGSPLYAVYSDPAVWVKAMGYCMSGDPSVLLEKYNGPAFFNLLSPLEDQQTGGIIMKLLQEVMYGFILAYIFFHWYRREHADDDKQDVPNAETQPAN
ncbi:cytochrome c oxidase assembly factor CtaG [Paenibacillus curdlanolyticus YK9]|uniref:Cytochrome c oxidase assembly factor CtaG n=1 Tax=Paenibacillus curdlanolyticus YK9 TaxID=717606 RepID=E0I7U4_9BACL|nr:cytochrome c oxidase assembly factor CtaG [Paenibacillus curdlanolyticus]EFM11249.1 cytochrome c oxidase assembly factor CtaG [Paenibacillus curdlanolyticus YK9]